MSSPSSSSASSASSSPASSDGSSPIDPDQIRTIRDFMSNYNRLSELCFRDCVWDFTSRAVSRGEENCALNCAEKYLKMNQRISTRFQEFQMIANENAIAQMTKTGMI